MSSLNLTAFKHVRWERYCQLTATVVLSWEYLITWDSELQYFWKKRWSFGKSIFLWSRYYSLFFNIGNAVVFMQERPSYETTAGSRFFHWQNTGAGIQVVTTHIILGLRLYAMYGSNKKLSTFFVVLLIGEIIIMFVIFGSNVRGPVVTNNPSEGVYMCADADPPHRHWIAYYWTTILSVESILLSLSLYKAYENYKTGAGGNLMRVLSRESVLYFVIIFWIYLANQILWIINDPTLNELCVGFSFCVSAILANRLMITVRAKYYAPLEHTHDAFGTIATEGVPTLAFRSTTACACTAGRAHVSQYELVQTHVCTRTGGATGGGEGAQAQGETLALTTMATRSVAHGTLPDIELENFSERRGF